MSSLGLGALVIMPNCAFNCVIENPHLWFRLGLQNLPPSPKQRRLRSQPGLWETKVASSQAEGKMSTYSHFSASKVQNSTRPRTREGSERHRLRVEGPKNTFFIICYSIWCYWHCPLGTTIWRFLRPGSSSDLLHVQEATQPAHEPSHHCRQLATWLSAPTQMATGFWKGCRMRLRQGL